MEQKKQPQHRNKYFDYVAISVDAKHLVKELCSMLNVKQCDLVEELIKEKYASVKSTL